MMRQLGTNPLDLINPPSRVVSLVPALTESFFDLGFGETIVGITDSCIHPMGKLMKIKRVGTPQDPDLSTILSLNPELILVNVKENPSQVIDYLSHEEITIWATNPKTVRELLDDLRMIAGLFQKSEAYLSLQFIEKTIELMISSLVDKKKIRYFLPMGYSKIDPGISMWKTFNRHTYSNDVLNIHGGENPFADRGGQSLLDGKLSEYAPLSSEGIEIGNIWVTSDEIRDTNPELIILPNELFGQDDTLRQKLIGPLVSTYAVRRNRIVYVDGSLITWSGTRIVRALQELPGLFN